MKTLLIAEAEVPEGDDLLLSTIYDACDGARADTTLGPRDVVVLTTGAVPYRIIRTVSEAEYECVIEALLGMGLIRRGHGEANGIMFDDLFAWR